MEILEPLITLDNGRSAMDYYITISVKTIPVLEEYLLLLGLFAVGWGEYVGSPVRL